MTAGDRLFATPPGIRLGHRDAIADGTARNFVLQLRAGRFHGFVVRRGESVFGYVDHCPHLGLPLAQTLDAYLTPDGSHITCGWHGALFTIDTGLCVGGPCTGRSLSAWPVHIVDDILFTG